MAQQCPNCGGYKVQPQREVMDCGTLGMLLILIAAGGVSGIVLLMDISFSENIVDFVKGIVADPVPYLGALLAVVLGAVALAVLTRSDPNLLECTLCGYKWDIRTKPEVRVRPDLIAKGEERLQEEERRRQEEAWWWLQQQKKK